MYLYFFLIISKNLLSLRNCLKDIFIYVKRFYFKIFFYQIYFCVFSVFFRFLHDKYYKIHIINSIFQNFFLTENQCIKASR